MPLPAAIQGPLARGDFDAIEEAWLEWIGEDGAAVAELAAAARAVSEAGADALARLLLEILDEQLRSDGRWAARLELLRHGGDLLVEADALHGAIVETVERVHGHRPTFAPLAEKVGIHRAPGDLPKTWKKIERLATLLEYDVGTVVLMEGKGAGRVVEVNLELGSLKLELEHHPELRVGFAAAPKLLKPLADDHFLRRKIEDPESLARLRDEAPGELLGVVLRSYDGARTAAEIRRDLAGVVEDAAWSSWWASARKHPQVVVHTQGRTAYAWADSDADAHAAVWRSFEDAPPRGKLELLRRDGERDPELRRRMVDSLVRVADAAVTRDPGLACELWLGLERLGAAPADVPWSAPTLLATTRDPLPLLAALHDRALRERAYDLVREARQEWPELYARAVLREADPRSLDRLADALAEVAPDRLTRLFDQLVGRPATAPATFVWLAERTARDEAWQRRKPLRLLQQILRALSDSDFASHRVRLGALCESASTVPRLLPHLSDDQAAKAAEIVDKAPGLEGYQRQLLVASLELKFPSLRKQQQAPLYALPSSIAAKREELRRLVEEELPANRRAIEEARALGDLRENFEYKAARQRHEYLSARAAALNRDLQRVRPIDPSQVTGEEVVVGSRVALHGTDGEHRTVTLLGPWESRPEADVLSNESELAASLLGHRKGEEVEIGERRYRIASIEAHAE